MEPKEEQVTVSGMHTEEKLSNGAREKVAPEPINPTESVAGDVPVRRHPVLVVIDGKRVTKRHVLEKRETLMGRDKGADLVFHDSKISRLHAKITWENLEEHENEPSCLLEDLRSRNGTTVNGHKITRHILRDGDRILLGSTVIGFYIKDDHELSLDEQLLAMATTDSLTGLANRLYFQTEARREFDRARRYGRPLSLIIVDLDHFKQVNDTYGHAAGDALLRQFAGILVVTMREGDVIGRLGGEEFGILLPETEMEGALSSANRLREVVDEHTFRYENISIHITISLGAAQYAPHHTNRLDFFESADKALYRAKSEGRNRVCVALGNLKR